MTELTPFRKILISFLCAFSFIAYVPLACAVGNDGRNDADKALAGEISTCCEEEETTLSVEDANSVALNGF